MWFLGKDIAAHFKVSVTGETVFFFDVWPIPYSRTGYIVTSEEDLQTLRSRVRTYHRWVSWAPAVLLGPVIAGLAEVGAFRWLSKDELLEGVVVGLVAVFATAVATGLAYRRFALSPILKKYRTAHAMMEYIDTEEVPVGWRRSESSLSFFFPCRLASGSFTTGRLPPGSCLRSSALSWRCP